MNKLEKKQIPQFAALCVLSAGVFGYFIVKIVTPSPAAAGTRPPPVAEAALTAPTVSPVSAKTVSPVSVMKAGPGPALPAAERVSAPVNEAEAPAPTPGMRDPFVVGYVDPKTQPNLPAAPMTKPAKTAGPQVASIHEIGPAPAAVSALSFGLKGFPPLGAAPALPAAPRLPASSKKAAGPKAPAPPAWTVTGVLQSEAGQVAVLRSGEARRIVRTGDFVDSAYRVMTVTRSAVVLRHGKTLYHLTLGAAKTAAPAPVRPALSSPAPVSGPAYKPDLTPIREPQDAVLAPGSRASGPEAGLTQVIQAALLLARSYIAPAQAEVNVCLAAFHARPALPPQAAMRFLDGSAFASGSHEARVHLERGRNLYQSGQRAEGRAQWQCVLTMDDLDAADEAGNLLARYN